MNAILNEINYQKARAEKAEYEAKRWRDVAEKQASLWAASKVLREKAEAERDALRAELREAQDAAELCCAGQDDLKKENDSLRAYQVPLCIGRPIIAILAEEGAWTSENGRSVVAASDLFGADPYSECDELRAECERLRHALIDVASQSEAARDQLAAEREALEPFAKLNVTRFMTDGCKYVFRIDAKDVRRARTRIDAALTNGDGDE